MENRSFDPQDVKRAFHYFRGTLILIMTTVVLLLFIMLWGIRIGEVSGTEVGILMDKITGKITVIDSAGTQIYNGFTKRFYTLDKTVQQVEMVSERGRGQVKGPDQIRVKTIDGSNVELDLTVIYEIDPAQIELIVNDSGVENAYKEKWVRDYARSICRTQFGELRTEEFYDSTKRSTKAIEAQEELNKKLKPHGLRVTSIIPENFTFYAEYEEKIKQKKLADQEVEEQTSKARAAIQRMERMRVEASKQKDVAVESFSGQMKELMVTAQAESERARQEADAYAISTRIGAEAQYYQMQKDAQATLASKKAEAEGTRKMAQALEGEGGVNIVKLEYAKKMEAMNIIGQPFTIQGITERFSHTQEAGAAAGRTNP